jgi:hypothetical protein
VAVTQKYLQGNIDTKSSHHPPYNFAFIETFQNPRTRPIAAYMKHPVQGLGQIVVIHPDKPENPPIRILTGCQQLLVIQNEELIGTEDIQVLP